MKYCIINIIRHLKKARIFEESSSLSEDMFTAQQADMSEASITEGLEKYKNMCAAISFKPGTERFGECVLV